MTIASGAFQVDDSSPDVLLYAAAAKLERCEGGVVFGGLVALSATAHEIRCEVIDPAPGTYRCAEEFAVLKENAARALEASRLAAFLPARPWHWVVPKD